MIKVAILFSQVLHHFPHVGFAELVARYQAENSRQN